MDTLTKLTTAEVFWAWITSFCQSGLISDTHINFQISPNGLNDYKGPENIKYTKAKYGETLTATTRHNTNCSEEKYILRPQPFQGSIVYLRHHGIVLQKLFKKTFVRNFGQAMKSLKRWRLLRHLTWLYKAWTWNKGNNGDCSLLLKLG